MLNGWWSPRRRPRARSTIWCWPRRICARVDEIWRIGGAQAIAALAYGTDTIDPVDVITGPGNAWVAEAKRQLYGVVGIDMVAGPSEILVISDNQSDPDWIAADLLSQAEHDPDRQSILITDDAQFAEHGGRCCRCAVRAAGNRADVARESWDDHGVLIVVEDLVRDAPALANRLAAEHVELVVDDPDAMFARIRHAGSVFLGRHTPEAVGDYVAGPNHVLPTGRRARFASGLSVLDFMKRTSFIELDEAALARYRPCRCYPCRNRRASRPCRQCESAPQMNTTRPIPRPLGRAPCRRAGAVPAPHGKDRARQIAR